MRRRLLILAALAAAAIVAYLPALSQPLLEDDYPNIALAIHFGPVTGWTDLAQNTTFRLRATCQVLTWWIYSAAGMNSAVYYAVAILLHGVNTWLVYALGGWRRIGYRASAWAALVFAVSEGHVEAVMWVSAQSELLQFLFGITAFLCWVRFLETSRWRWYGVSLVPFVLALISKESAAIFLALMFLPVILDFRAKTRWILPYAALTCVAVWSIFSARADSFRFSDGSFSLHAPFWITLPRSFFGILWIWGWVALAAIVVWFRQTRMVWIPLVWAGLGLIPYGFLTYTTRIPSRQTYLASAGVALLVGFGLNALRDKRRQLVIPVIAILIVHNVGYMLTRKRTQFLKRAEPTEQLIALSRQVRGSIYVKCFPRPRVVAEQAVWLATGRPASLLIWDPASASQAEATFCYQDPR